VFSYLEQHAEGHGNCDDPGTLDIDLFAGFQLHLAVLAHFFTNVRMQSKEHDGTGNGEASMESQIGPVVNVEEAESSDIVLQKQKRGA
jgi:hypothetical protein